MASWTCGQSQGMRIQPRCAGPAASACVRSDNGQHQRVCTALATLQAANAKGSSAWSPALGCDVNMARCHQLHRRVAAHAAGGYVPSPLDPNMQVAQSAVVAFALMALPAAWWFIVVPTSRRKLATGKRRGVPYCLTWPGSLASSAGVAVCQAVQDVSR